MPSNRSDEELVERCLGNDEGSWSELIVRYRRLIYSIPVAYRSPDADDVFQAVAVKLFENLGKLRNRKSLSSWIATTTRRECLAVIKKARRSVSLDEDNVEEPLEEPLDFVQLSFEVECEHMLHGALEKLDELCRTLIQAFYVEAPTPSYKEIAGRIGRPIGSLGPTRGRCLGKLREHYVELGGESPQGVSSEPNAPPME